MFKLKLFLAKSTFLPLNTVEIGYLVILTDTCQVPHLHPDGAPRHAGHHQRPRPPQVSQVVQVHNSFTENLAMDDYC